MKKPPAKQLKKSKKDLENPADTKAEIMATYAESWQGPLPPPAVLAEFSNVVDDGAERIMAAWENETSHRRSMEKKDLKASIADAFLGKVFAFLFVVIALGMSGYAAVNGAEWFATIVGGGTIGTVVWAFVHSSKPPKV